jgi:hypothetical protein
MSFRMVVSLPIRQWVSLAWTLRGTGCFDALPGWSRVIPDRFNRASVNVEQVYINCTVANIIDPVSVRRHRLRRLKRSGGFGL